MTSKLHDCPKCKKAMLVQKWTECELKEFVCLRCGYSQVATNAKNAHSRFAESAKTPSNDSEATREI
jgi:Zn ribbon nucleic-acid-binding protein